MSKRKRGYFGKKKKKLYHDGKVNKMQRRQARVDFTGLTYRRQYTIRPAVGNERAGCQGGKREKSLPVNPPHPL